MKRHLLSAKANMTLQPRGEKRAKCKIPFKFFNVGSDLENVVIARGTVHDDASVAIV
jgi:hypothetical protein